MYGEKAAELIRELKRCLSSHNKGSQNGNASQNSLSCLSTYNETVVHQIIEEICALYNEIHATLENESETSLKLPYVASRLIVHHTAIQRNKRCLLAYLWQRIKRIEKIRWHYGPVIPPGMKKKLLSSQEAAYFRKYSHCLNSYMKNVRVDLTADLQPPKSLYIEVRCTVDYGEIQTEHGTVNLSKNSQHYLRRSDVEGLVKQGILTHIA